MLDAGEDALRSPFDFPNNLEVLKNKVYNAKGKKHRLEFSRKEEDRLAL